MQRAEAVWEFQNACSVRLGRYSLEAIALSTIKSVQDQILFFQEISKVLEITVKTPSKLEKRQSTLVVPELFEHDLMDVFDRGR